MMENFNIHKNREKSRKTHHVPHHLASPIINSWAIFFYLLPRHHPPFPTHIGSF